jgi:ABC-2 type transport system ATP-binding protein
MCNRVIIIDRGKIVADDQVDNLRDRSTQQNLIVAEFEVPPDEKLLMKIKGINKIETEENKIKIFVDPDIDIRADIFKLASDNNLTLIGLNKEDASLENIFQQLTSNKKSKD